VLSEYIFTELSIPNLLSFSFPLQKLTVGESRTQLGWSMCMDAFLAEATSALVAHLALLAVRTFGLLIWVRGQY
jgi:hypothetical protein